MLANIFSSTFQCNRLWLDEMGYYYGIINLEPQLQKFADNTKTGAFKDGKGEKS